LLIERQPQREAAGARHQLDRRAVGGDAIELALLAAAPDVALAVDGQPLGVVQARLAEDAVEEDDRALEGDHRPPDPLALLHARPLLARTGPRAHRRRDRARRS